MKTKVKKGWYRFGDLHLVVTERYGNDKRLDWVCVRGHEEANRVWHGGVLGEVIWVGNRLCDFDPSTLKDSSDFR